MVDYVVLSDVLSTINPIVALFVPPGIVLPRYYDHVYIFVFVNIEIKTLELFTCKGWLHTLGL